MIQPKRSFFLQIRSYATLRAADLDWIVGPGYSWGRYIWGVLNVSLRASGTQLGLDLTCFVIHCPVTCRLSSALRGDLN